jgi:branched-subunit amino acid transport protein
MRNGQQQQQQRVELITTLARMVAVLGCTVSVYPARFLPLVLGRAGQGSWSVRFGLRYRID